MMQPSAVLIEGPSDFNEHLHELQLDHELPIAIYSYFRMTIEPDAESDMSSAVPLQSGVYYPFCEYSPEWVALRSGFANGADVRFIDLPWSESFGDERATHRYADAELRHGRYVSALCERLQVNDFDELWDRMIESQMALSLDDYLRRTHEYCLNTRYWQQDISPSDRRREAFMASQIRTACEQGSGPVLVVTGGFHSSALLARVEGIDDEDLGIDDPESLPADLNEAVQDSGIALTNYSFRQLDGLTGYNAGMPSPGFYQQVWQQRVSNNDGTAFDHEPLLNSVVDAIRKRKQTLSTADLIAVQTSAQALAAIRGRQHVWRRDLVDAVTTSLIKDELEYTGSSPMLDAVHDVLRGTQTGKLAAGTRLPPLVHDIRSCLERYGLTPAPLAKTLELDLLASKDADKSRLLHQLLALEIGGIQRVGGTDFLARDDMQQIWETWKVRWTPSFESSCIEAARYGTALASAVATRLTEKADRELNDASAAAELLITASRCGAETLSKDLIVTVARLIASEPRFIETAAALGHVLFLYCYDEALGTTRLPQLQSLIAAAFSRSLWLLDALGSQASTQPELLQGLQNLLETYRRVADVLDLADGEFASVLARVQSDIHKPPQVRGGAAGILWSIGAASADSVRDDMHLFSSPVQLGDYLSGLFALAREVAQRNPLLVNAIDAILLQFDGEQFQTALPALRLAFTSFSPREKHYLLSTLFESLGIMQSTVSNRVAADVTSATEALAIEDQIFEAIAKYGLEQIDGEI